jgi:hypothetical protein
MEEDMLDDMIDELILEAMLEEIIEDEPTRGGSLPGKAPNQNRDFQGAYDRLLQNYFTSVRSTYDEKNFENRFRMPRAVFDRIQHAIIGHHPFVQQYNAVTGLPTIRPLVRLCACICKLATGSSADALDENFAIAKSTLTEDCHSFTRLIRQEFGPQYMNRCPKDQEIARSVAMNADRGFPGAIASWDCKHFRWDNCPVASHGEHRGKEGDETIILEAICDRELYVWQHLFGEPGSLNDLNIRPAPQCCIIRPHTPCPVSPSRNPTVKYSLKALIPSAFLACLILHLLMELEMMKIEMMEMEIMETKMMEMEMMEIEMMEMGMMEMMETKMMEMMEMM